MLLELTYENLTEYQLRLMRIGAEACVVKALDDNDEVAYHCAMQVAGDCTRELVRLGAELDRDLPV